jgi:hypothetical protein
VGAFELVAAVSIQPGDRLVVSLDAAGGAAGRFAAAVVAHNEEARAPGSYTPVTEHPFLVVDDLVMPL